MKDTEAFKVVKIKDTIMRCLYKGSVQCTYLYHTMRSAPQSKRIKGSQEESGLAYRNSISYQNSYKQISMLYLLLVRGGN